MKDIKGYEGLYAVTSCGRVWSYKSKKFLKPASIRGYLAVTLYDEKVKKTKKIHKLVAEAYLLPPPKDMANPQVDHIDGNKEHNYVNNLQWLSAAENNAKGHKRAVRCIETGKVYESSAAATRELGLRRCAVSDAVRRKQKAGGYHWEVI